MSDQPLPPPPSLSASYPLTSNYVRLGTPSWVMAYITVLMLVIVAMIGVYMWISNFSIAGSIGSIITLFLLYLNYNIVAHAINCDNNMFGKDASVPYLRNAVI
jgi:hypothetical protein